MSSSYADASPAHINILSQGRWGSILATHYSVESTVEEHGFSRALPAIYNRGALAPAMQTNRTFFVTTICADRNPIFRNEAAARTFLDVFFEYREQKRYLIHAFVVMPDHLHALISPGASVSLEKAMQFIKGGSSFRLGKLLPPKAQVWQRGFTQHRIRDEMDFRHHAEYIHQNPVRAGLVRLPAEYPYSSAHDGFALDPSPFDLRG